MIKNISQGANFHDKQLYSPNPYVIPKSVSPQVSLTRSVESSGTEKGDRIIKSQIFELSRKICGQEETLNLNLPWISILLETISLMKIHPR